MSLDKQTAEFSRTMKRNAVEPRPVQKMMITRYDAGSFSWKWRAKEIYRLSDHGKRRHVP